MSETVTPLGGAEVRGSIATVREIGPLGMIMLRLKADTGGAAAVEKSVGTDLPGLRRMTRSGDRALAWMSPDEYLIIVPHAEVQGTLAALNAGLAGTHHLAADVSDARAVFRVEGGRADAVIRTLCPVDLAHLPEGEVRRTRAAQVACALWREEDGFTLVTFRSVARYAQELLANAAS